MSEHLTHRTHMRRSTEGLLMHIKGSGHFCLKKVYISKRQRTKVWSTKM